jgi:heat shock protein HtpX
MLKNYGKTAVLLAALGGLVMVIGSLFGPGGLYIGLAIGLAMVGFSFWFSDKLAIASARAVEVGPEQAPEYHRIMHELSQRAGTPMPRLYIAPSDQPNAFATGRSPRKAAVCVNQGLLQLMSWDEVRGVLAHELMHVKNRDVLTGSIAAAVGMAITFVARMAMFGAMFGGGGDRDRDNNPIALLAAAILAPIAAMVIQMAISRSREYHADAAAARLIGDGEPLARALERLEGYAGRIPAAVNPSQASNYIVNPLRGASGVQFANLFSTHPPVQERVRRLRDRSWA